MTIILKTAFVLCYLSFALLGEGYSQEPPLEGHTSEALQKERGKVADESDVFFEDDMMHQVFYHYLQVQRALVDSDAAAAQTAAARLAKYLTDEYASLNVLSQQIADADDIEQQRAFFAEFTAQVEPFVKETLSDGKIYKQFCPMAFNNKGAYWLANTKNIKNPYFGGGMLTCGRTEETIQ